MPGANRNTLAVPATPWGLDWLLNNTPTQGLADLALPWYAASDYATINALATAAGAGPYAIVVNADRAVTANLGLGAGIHLHYEPGRQITVNNGVTLTIESPEHIHCPVRQPAFALAGTGRVALQVAGTVYPGWWGAAADGVADDGPAIRAALTALQSGGQGGRIVFPTGSYRVTSTIEVLGGRMIVFQGELGTVNWNTVELGDHRIFWDGPGSTTPVFYLGGLFSGVSFENLVIDGQATPGVGPMALAGIWADDHHAEVHLRNCRFRNCYLGVRICSGYNYSDGSYEAGRNRYTGVLDPVAQGNGGYQSDNWAIENCGFGFCAKAGISIESSQSLDDRITKCQFMGLSEIGIHLVACQGVAIDSPTFLGLTVAAILAPMRSSSGAFAVNDAHTETGAEILFESTNASAYIAEGITFRNCTGGHINIRGLWGTVTIANSRLQTVSMKTADISLVIRDTYLQGLDKTAGLDYGPRLELTNVYILGAVSDNAFAYVQKSLTNVRLEAKIGADPLWANLIRVQRFGSVGYLPDLVLGDLAADSAAHGMDGVTLNGCAGNLAIGCGCYLDAAGAWIATKTAGAVVQVNATNFLFWTFTGATIGLSPTFVDQFYAGQTYGVYLPRLNADPSAEPGTLYYNTASGKVRIRDAVGWRDF